MKKLILSLLILQNMQLAQIHINNDSINIDKNIKSWATLRNENLTRQQFDYSCGSASLSTILTYYYGKTTSEKEILESVLQSKGIDTTKQEELAKDERLKKTLDLSFLDLSQYAQSKGFKAIGLALNLETLQKLKAPVIVYINVREIEHFSVYKGIKDDFIYLADPSFGNIKIRLDRFKEMFYTRLDSDFDSNLLGKILAILPNSNTTQINQDFMNIESTNALIYEVIKDKI